MKAFAALLAALNAAGLAPQQVAIPGPMGVTLQAAFVEPVGGAHDAGVVALHGCGGPVPDRDAQWAKRLVADGHPVVFPDSFGSRGLGSQCKIKQRPVRPSGLRRQDAIAAAAWLHAQPGVASGGIVLVGWSNGGGTVLFTAARDPAPSAGLFARFVAFYPGCRTELESGWAPSGPLLILVGANDDWTPAAPCEALARKYPDLITLQVYSGAWHDFDRPDHPVVRRTGLATPPSGTGVAHVGTNPVARADTLARVPAFIDGG